MVGGYCVRAERSANDAPYWPACVREPGFLPWLSRIAAIANNTQPNTPAHSLVRMAQKQGAAPPEWVQAARFLVEQAHKG